MSKVWNVEKLLEDFCREHSCPKFKTKTKFEPFSRYTNNKTSLFISNGTWAFNIEYSFEIIHQVCTVVIVGHHFGRRVKGDLD